MLKDEVFLYLTQDPGEASPQNSPLKGEHDWQ